MKNHLICWLENGEKKWNMVKSKDSNSFLLTLIEHPAVDHRTIFILPTGGRICRSYLALSGGAQE